MITLVCVLLSGAGFYLSVGLGAYWVLAWIAPVPVLWLAFGPGRAWRALAAAFAAYALGGLNLLSAYGGALPAVLLGLCIFGPALLFAVSVAGARRVARRFGPVAGVLAFATLWAGLDFLSSFGRAGGSVLTPAAAEVGAPVLVQSAALVGFAGITFLLGAVSAGIAAALRARKFAPALVALCLFAANAGFGAWRISAPAAGHLRVALFASNQAVGPLRRDDEAGALKAINAYAGQIDGLTRRVDLIVLPENIARVAPAWAAAAQAPLAAAASRANATVIAGFNTAVDGAQRNVAWAFVPGAAAPATYAKRRLVPGLETSAYAPGKQARVLANGIGLEICKDMDFQGMIRRDARAGHPILFAVPAWDFDADRWSHARVAILRSIEDGVPMARAARVGLLTINDRYGRVLARANVGQGFAVLVGEVPLHGRTGATLYARIGNVFGWLCLVVGAGLWGMVVPWGARST